MMTGWLLALVMSTETLTAGPVRLECKESGGWKFDLTAEKAADGVEVVRIAMNRDTAAPPPQFSVSWSVPLRSAHHFWSCADTHYGSPWSQPYNSDIANQMPLYAFVGTGDTNRYAFACDETCRRLVFTAPVSETEMAANCRFRFFTVPEAPIGAYAVRIRLDGRALPYWETLGDGVDWMCDAAGIVPLEVPESAYEPLYSTWYAFHQDVSAALVDEELALAAPMGMKSVILDDGWQIDLPLGNRAWGGYYRCGDWRPGRNFPDMAAHVRKAHGLGYRYMVWYSVPFIGERSAAFAQFKGKYLPKENNCAGGWVVDPRFPEVREYLIRTYEKAVRDWDLDGFKFDFIGRFSFKGDDPAVAENYAGRDIKSVPLAVDRLLTDVMTRLKALKPGILIEFRQPYISPAIRKFGNMIRAGDCPMSMVENRTRTARLRLTSGKTAVHSDMLEWRSDESAEEAARYVLNSMFSVIQYSVRLAKAPASHRRMMSHWIAFSRRHRAALVKGAFRPHFPANDYSLLEGESGEERVFGVYQNGLTVPTGEPDRRVIVLNGTERDVLAVDFSAVPKAVEAFDTFGVSRGLTEVGVRGLRSVPVPRSGYLQIDF